MAHAGSDRGKALVIVIGAIENVIDISKKATQAIRLGQGRREVYGEMLKLGVIGHDPVEGCRFSGGRDR